MATSCHRKPPGAAPPGTGGDGEDRKIDAFAKHFLQCRMELAFLQYAMRRLSSSPTWTSELGEHLEILENLLRRESSDVLSALAALPASSMAHLRAKATALSDVCDPNATDLRNS